MSQLRDSGRPEAGTTLIHCADSKFLPVRTGKSITGARLATEEYVKGDLQMAKNKQEEYAKAPTAQELKGPKK
ncbi:DUF6507 family protein [Streptomyces yangpuensis]|uniref:DUF6507 family protein n=1 Tax=Streptomyces yangpuensis TaxID=1648182 RepID=UPI00364BACE8